MIIPSSGWCAACDTVVLQHDGPEIETAYDVAVHGAA